MASAPPSGCVRQRRNGVVASAIVQQPWLRPSGGSSAIASCDPPPFRPPRFRRASLGIIREIHRTAAWDHLRARHKKEEGLQ
jgi:hypothetical protein